MASHEEMEMELELELDLQNSVVTLLDVDDRATELSC
jgi:hypothetical protein